MTVVMKKQSIIDNGEKMVRINFHNPVTDKSDYILFPETLLEKMRLNAKNGVLLAISFFFSDGDKNYLLNLHIDNENKVRTEYTTNFLLYIDKKIFSPL